VHFHLLGEDGANSYIRDSSIHRSYYRCVSIHGTNRVVVSQNVGFDVIGYCYYLEGTKHASTPCSLRRVIVMFDLVVVTDGAEEHNTFEYNLAAHVHFLGAPARSSNQFTGWVSASDDLILPADVSAAGFYATNSNNRFVGNAASGGWSGFAFPMLRAPIKLHRHMAGTMNPSAKPLLEFVGNSAHSAGCRHDPLELLTC
jgi:hypothetical protein